jgi:hypothetical protein
MRVFNADVPQINFDPSLSKECQGRAELLGDDFQGDYSLLLILQQTYYLSDITMTDIQTAVTVVWFPCLCHISIWLNSSKFGH